MLTVVGVWGEINQGGHRCCVDSGGWMGCMGRSKSGANPYLYQIVDFRTSVMMIEHSHLILDLHKSTICTIQPLI